MKKLVLIILSILVAFSAISCSEESEITVYAPDGAPALSLVKAMDELEGYDFNITSADVIQTVVTGDKKADICILPVNLASKLLSDGKSYKMLGAITHGNFYFISSSNESVNAETAENLIGKTIGVVQLASIAGLSLKASLVDLDIPYQELINGALKDESKVNLLPITAVEIGTADVDLYLAPSPVADVKAKALNYNFVGSLNDLYSLGDIPQAIIVAKTELINKNLDGVKKFINAVKGAKTYLLSKDKNDICTSIKNNLESGLTPQFTANNLTDNAIERSSIYFTSASDCYLDVNAFLLKVKAVQSTAVGTMSNDFYYLESL